MANSNYIQIFRSPETFELLENDPKAYLLLSLIALRARRTDSFNVDNLQIGEAKIGDHEKIGLTQGEYRGAKKRLKRYGFATFKTTNKGTIAKLIDSNVFNINAEEKTNKRQSTDKLKTTNNNEKNDKKKRDRNDEDYYFTD